GSNASKLLRQSEDVHGVAAAGRVRLGSQAGAEGSDRAAAGRDGDELAAIDRIRHGAADGLRGKPRLPQDLASVGIKRPQITVHRAVEQEPAAGGQDWRVVRYARLPAPQRP